MNGIEIFFRKIMEISKWSWKLFMYVFCFCCTILHLFIILFLLLCLCENGGKIMLIRLDDCYTVCTSFWLCLYECINRSNCIHTSVVSQFIRGWYMWCCSVFLVYSRDDKITPDEDTGVSRPQVINQALYSRKHYQSHKHNMIIAPVYPEQTSFITTNID